MIFGNLNYFGGHMNKKSAERIKKLVAEQAEDEGLWFNAVYITEDYLQRALRKLHRVIENELGKT